jgi:hypothetical protein
MWHSRAPPAPRGYPVRPPAGPQVEQGALLLLALRRSLTPKTPVLLSCRPSGFPGDALRPVYLAALSGGLAGTALRSARTADH